MFKYISTEKDGLTKNQKPFSQGSRMIFMKIAQFVQDMEKV